MSKMDEKETKKPITKDTGEGDKPATDEQTKLEDARVERMEKATAESAHYAIEEHHLVQEEHVE